MKLLMFYINEWWYRTASKNLPDVPDVEKEEAVENAAVIFFHCEAEDEERETGSFRSSSRIQNGSPESLAPRM